MINANAPNPSPTAIQIQVVLGESSASRPANPVVGNASGAVSEAL